MPFTSTHDYHITPAMSRRFFETPESSADGSVEKFIDIEVNGRGETIIRMEPSANSVAFRYNDAWSHAEQKIVPVLYTRETLEARIAMLQTRRGLDQRYVARQVELYQVALDRVELPTQPERPTVEPAQLPLLVAALG